MRISHLFRIINVVLLVIFSIDGNCQSMKTVVLDAGHGGKDPGTVNGKNYEKTINLEVVKLTGMILEKNPRIKVIYTRNDDRFVKLDQRSKIAMDAKADLFVSVHTNASPNKKAAGTETYIMGVDKGNANLGVAMRENGVISLEKDYSTAYEGYDPTSSESLIMFSLMQYSYSRESLELAAKLQAQYRSLSRRDNGVRQAGFLVLWRNAMPSVLTELGYLSNDEEAKFLLSKQGQQSLAKAIAASVEAYFEECENLPTNKTQTAQTAQPSQSTKPSQSTNQPPKNTQKPIQDVSITGIEDDELMSEDFLSDYAAIDQQENEELQKPQNRPSNSSKKDASVFQKSELASQIQPQFPCEKPNAVFAVQIRSTKQKVALNSTNFGPLVMQVIERKVEKSYKYTVGTLLFYKEALLLQDKIRKLYPDAFIVAFNKEGRQISVGEAKKLNEI